MTVRTRRFIVALSLGAMTAVPLSASAQTTRFYKPPKIVAMGTHSAAVRGVGMVEIKVFIKSDGSSGATQVVKSTNHADDAAALEIARSSKYRPGTLDGKPGAFFYTVTLKFNGNSVSSGDLQPGGGGDTGLSEARALVHAGKWSDAKTSLGGYLTAHPGDKEAEILLGVADGFSADNVGAAAAFDAGGTIPKEYVSVAVRAYTEAAVAEITAKNYDASVGYATKSLALAPTDFNILYLRGTANANGQHYPEAIADLEKAKSLAASANGTEKTRLLIDEALASSYILGGQTDKGLAMAQDIKKRDPSVTNLNDVIETAYAKQAVAYAADGKPDAALAAYESAAKVTPAHATRWYTQAANLLASAKTPDWKAVRAEADKGLVSSPNDARANYIAGIAAANSTDKAGALVYLQKAKANVGTDSALSTQVDAALKAIGQK